MKRIICAVIAAAFILTLAGCARVDTESVVKAVSDFAGQEKFKVSMSVKQSYTEDEKENVFIKQYTKLSCDTLLGYEYYEHSGTLFLNGEDKGTQLASFYPPLKILSLNDTVTTGKEYSNYVSASDMLFWRTDVIPPTEDDIKKADIFESDGAITYKVSAPSEDSIKALADYIGSDVVNVEFSYILKEGKLVSYTQKYDLTGSAEMHIEVTADIEAVGDEVEKYDDGEVSDGAENTDTSESEE